MAERIKVLTADGVKALFDLLSLQDYPNNDVLEAVINAIDETKADKEYINEIFNMHLLNINYDVALGFDTSEIVFENTSTTSILGQAILGQMILA